MNSIGLLKEKKQPRGTKCRRRSWKEFILAKNSRLCRRIGDLVGKGSYHKLAVHK
jgi:hypothetical protein